jgi:hypothetical protein
MLPVDLAAFAAAAEWHHLPRHIAALRLEVTATDLSFPGALLPRLRQDGSIVWYAAAPTAHAWRRLRPLLLSYAGPTVTAFTGIPTELNQFDPTELVLLKGGVFAAALLVSPPGGTDLALRALARLVAAVGRVPREATPPSPSTGTLLAFLDMNLAAVARGLARTIALPSSATSGGWTQLISFSLR